MNSKSILLSKTFWFNVIVKLTGILGLVFPAVNSFLAQHPSAILISIGVAGVILRAVTAGKVTLTDDLDPTKP